MKRYRIYNILWDCDGENPKQFDLPLDFVVDVDDDLNMEHDGANIISDYFGFCIHGFDFQEVTL